MSPAPWKVVHFEDGSFGVADADGIIVVAFSTKRAVFREQDLANAYLIAAAPALLAALKASLKIVEHYHEREGCQTTLDLVCTALVKASPSKP